MARRGVVSELGRLLDERRDREADLVPRRIVGRNTDGSEQMQRMTSECVERENVGSHKVGQVIQLPAPPPYQSRGVTGVPTGYGLGGLLIHVESQSPKVLPAGATTSVTITGRGFVSGMSWEYLESDGKTVNAEITVDSSTFDSATQYTLSVTVASTATVEEDLPIAWSA